MNSVKDRSHALILGRARESAVPPDPEDSVGHRRMPPLHVPTGGDLFTMDRGHLMTVAPAESSKADSVIIPNLLNYAGPVVVVDPRGEYYRATAERRRAMGQKVFRLDPFGVIDGQGTDALNPRDLLSTSGPLFETDCQAFLFDVLSFPVSSADYWERLAVSLATGVIGYICTVPEKRALVRELVNMLRSKDMVYDLAVVLDTIGKKIPPFSYNAIAAFLQNAEADRQRVASIFYSFLQGLTSEEVLKSLEEPGIPLGEVTRGDAISIYLMVPPEKLRSHSRLLRLWIGTLVLARRQDPVSPRTLFILDECAQLGMITRLAASIPVWERGGLLLWTFWQDLDQARNLYAPSWTTMATAVQVLEMKNYSQASELAAFLGVEPGDILSLARDEQIVCLDRMSHRIKNVNYHSDPLFA